MELAYRPRRFRNRVNAVNSDAASSTVVTFIAPSARPTTKRSSRTSVFIPRKRRFTAASSNRTATISAGRQHVDPAEEVNKLLSTDPIYRDAFQADFKGPGVRKKRGERYETRAETEEVIMTDRVVRELKNMHVEGLEALVSGLKRDRAEKLQRDPYFAVPDRPFGEKPRRRDKSTRKITLVTGANARTQDVQDRDARAKRRRIDEVQREDAPVSVLPTRNQDFQGLPHVAEPIPEQKDIEEIYDQPEDNNPATRVFCVCKASTPDLMVPCYDCATPFHPGCVGQGLGAAELYTSGFRMHGWRADAELYAHGKHYRCNQCTKKYGKLVQQDLPNDKSKAKAPKRDEVPSTFQVNSHLGKRAFDSDDRRLSNGKAELESLRRSKRARDGGRHIFTAEAEIDSLRRSKRSRGHGAH